jgi:hypothetical protein
MVCIPVAQTHFVHAVFYDRLKVLINKKYNLQVRIRKSDIMVCESKLIK